MGLKAYNTFSEAISLNEIALSSCELRWIEELFHLTGEPIFLKAKSRVVAKIHFLD